MRMNVVCALADIVATKLGIILFISSFRLLFSQNEFAYDFEFLHAFLRTKKIRFSQSSFLGEQHAECVRYGKARTPLIARILYEKVTGLRL